jgi:hypothetical protein
MKNVFSAKGSLGISENIPSWREKANALLVLQG